MVSLGWREITGHAKEPDNDAVRKKKKMATRLEEFNDFISFLSLSLSYLKFSGLFRT